jgi:hypothetical protein
MTGNLPVTNRRPIGGNPGRFSVFRQSLPPRRRNPDPTDLDRLATSLDHLVLCCCKPGGEESGEHLPLEAMAEYEQVPIDAVLIAGEQL